LDTIIYSSQDKQVSWAGISVSEGSEFESFMTARVASRLNDETGSQEFESHLRGLAATGFARTNLDNLLNTNIPEERVWAIGEAVAEAYLTYRHNITWPWNMERDKRTPMASLPGADLVGFETDGENVRLVLGEVKTSGDISTPPNVMYGRSGITHQIDNLASNLSLIVQLLKWLLPRCKGTQYETSFNAAITLLLNSKIKAIALFGVLIRDTTPNELDLQSRGHSLSNNIQTPTTCQLIALYLPCSISTLPHRIFGDVL
jgi:hypothetical protein